MGPFFTAFSQTPKNLWYGLILCVFLYSLIDLYLINIPELFTGGSLIGVIIKEICLAFIAGFFFYAIVSQLRENKDKQHLDFFIRKRINNIISDFAALTSQLERVVKSPMSLPPTNLEVKSFMQGLDGISEKSTSSTVNAISMTWAQRFGLNQLKARNEIEKLYLISTHVDSELLEICSKIDDCRFFEMLEQIRMINVQVKWAEFSDMMYDWYRLHWFLAKYAYDKHIYDFTPEEKSMEEKGFFSKAFSEKGMSYEELVEWAKMNLDNPI